jgi:hypothetical protein
MFCGDNGRFANHDENPSTISTSGTFSDDIAARDLFVGDEFTCDYRAICDLVSETGQLFR